MPKVTPKHRDVLATSIFIAGGNIGFAFAPLVVALFFRTLYRRQTLLFIISGSTYCLRNLHAKTAYQRKKSVLISCKKCRH